jgi:hypothetical protein
MNILYVENHPSFAATVTQQFLSQHSVKIISGSLCTLLIGSGFILGICALFGISRHGRKGILGRAAVGVVVNGLLLVFMGLAVMRMIEH